MSTDPAASPLRACPVCGASGDKRFCAACGSALDAAPPSARKLLREDALEHVGLDRRILQTLRDLVLHPVRIVSAYMSGQTGAYLPPLRVFFTLGGLYVLVCSFVEPLSLAAVSDNLMAPGGQLQPSFARLLQRYGLTQALVSERFESRMNAVMPGAIALSMLPLLPLLRAMDRRRSWYEHLMFLLGASGVAWAYGLLAMPLALVSAPAFQVVVGGATLAAYGLTFVSLYPGRSGLRTALRFTLFAVVMSLLGITVVTIALLGTFALCFRF
jgi:hypothetical protein